jgi:N-acetylmuramoyl-L-alanine amidase
MVIIEMVKNLYCIEQKETKIMRIANRKRFMGSCIFFTFLLLIFGKNQILFRETTSPIVKAVEKNREFINSSSKAKYKNHNKKYVVVLDAGHGGADFGTSYKNLKEKDLTFKIVKYAEKYLEDEGYTVVLTRNADKLIPLKEIGNIANEAKADAFVSIHINSLDDINYKGITAYYYDGKGYETDKRIKLAKTIEGEILKNDSWENKGIRKANFAVLRYTKMPSALIECGFITNEEDRTKLGKHDVLRRLAKNVSNGIIKYLDQCGNIGYTENEEDYAKYIGDANQNITNKSYTTEKTAISSKQSSKVANREIYKGNIKQRKSQGKTRNKGQKIH